MYYTLEEGEDGKDQHVAHYGVSMERTTSDVTVRLMASHPLLTVVPPRPPTVHNYPPRAEG